MPLELGKSDDEELPTVHFLKKQLPEVTNHTVQPSQRGEVLELGSSDSEGSSVASPAWKKPCARQDSSRAATHMEGAVELSSDSEDEDVIPLAERLKRKFSNSEPATTSTSFTKIRNLSTQHSAKSKTLDSNDEPVATDCEQRSLPKTPAIQGRAAPNSWELSDSDPEAISCVPKKQPSVQPTICLSDCLAPNSSSRTAELDLPPFPLPTKTKRSKEEFDKARQIALNRRKEREAQKLLQKEEKERKKAAANLWKAQKPGECLKHIQVVLDPDLLQVEGGGLLLTTLQSMECSCTIESHVVSRSVVWRRKTGLAQIDQPTWTEEPNIVVLVLLEEFVSMVHSYRKVSKEVPAETLQSFVDNIMKKTPGKTLALVVVGLENYFSSNKHKSQKKQQHQATQCSNEALEQGKQRNRRDKTNSAPRISRVDVEEALVALQLHSSTQIRILESWKDFGDFISMFTKAVAEAPFKKERDKASFSFCLEGDWTSGMKVDHSGKGLLQIWKKQIQQLNRVSLEMANAIVAKYPSPQLLVQAYGTQSSEQERYKLLADIPIRRGDGVTATTRRVGPELSKRVYLQMTSHNPELSLDVTG